jgi:threonine aldolase
MTPRNSGRFVSRSGLTRRTFLGTAAAGAALAASPRQAAAAHGEPAGDRVHFLFDGLDLSPAESSELLGKLVRDGKAGKDVYLNGGCVAELETRVARLLGKERAAFLPTGTLANHLALRCQAAGKSRVLVQADSHVYRDTLDCVPTLSHLNLVPLAPGKATVPLDQVEEAYRQAAARPFPVGVGVISLECPVRRQLGEAFDVGEMARISAFARKHDIRMHLDGARLWIASAYTGVSPAEYAALFDTVYVSLYKYLNAGAGAVLAGPRGVIEQVTHAQKQFGGGMYQAWPYAAVALHYLDGFAERFQKAKATAEALYERLGKHPRFRVERIPNGTNIAKLHVKDVEGPRYRAALQRSGITLNNPRPGGAEFFLTVNESLNRRPAEELAKAFIAALGDSSGSQGG